MFIVTSFKENYNKETGCYTITTETLAKCPQCQNPLKYRNSRSRGSISSGGEMRVFNLRRFWCCLCKSLQTEIPSIIQPYKHYSAEAIQSVLDGGAESKSCVADDSTMRRWRSSFKDAQEDIVQRVTSVFIQSTGASASVLPGATPLDTIKSGATGWLAYVMALLINRGHKLCTRFAFCPSCPAGIVVPASRTTGERGSKNEQTVEDTS